MKSASHWNRVDWFFQVWRGSLVLADYILSRADDFKGVIGLEVGAGPGFAGLVLAMAASKVFLTGKPNVLVFIIGNPPLNEPVFCSLSGKCPMGGAKRFGTTSKALSTSWDG